MSVTTVAVLPEHQRGRRRWAFRQVRPGRAASWRRRTGIEPAWSRYSTTSVLKTAGATRHPDASAGDLRDCSAAATRRSRSLSVVVAMAEVGAEQLVADLRPDHARPGPATPQPAPAPSATCLASTRCARLVVHQDEAQRRHRPTVVPGTFELVESSPYRVHQLSFARPIHQRRQSPG